MVFHILWLSTIPLSLLFWSFHITGPFIHAHMHTHTHLQKYPNVWLLSVHNNEVSKWWDPRRVDGAYRWTPCQESYSSFSAIRVHAQTYSFAMKTCMKPISEYGIESKTSLSQSASFRSSLIDHISLNGTETLRLYRFFRHQGSPLIWDASLLHVVQHRVTETPISLPEMWSC